MNPNQIIKLSELEKRLIPIIEFEPEDLQALNLLSPDSDKYCDIRRLEMLFKINSKTEQITILVSNWTAFNGIINNCLKMKNGLFRSCKNIVITLKYLRSSKEQRILLNNFIVKAKYNVAPPGFTLKEAKYFINYLGSDRFYLNAQVLVGMIKYFQTVRNNSS